MKPIASIKLLLTGTFSIGIAMSSAVTAQLPPIVDNNSQTDLSVSGTPANNDRVVNAATTNLKVSCQNLATVVQKGDRQATMLTWNYDGFGKDFTPEKRCQIVSERLQKVADNNGGTFKDLQLASGTMNSQVVICALPAKSSKCNRQNILFTLKPENARNPEAVVQKIFGFAQDGSSSINESASNRTTKLDPNLGTWEQKTFPQTKRATNVDRKKVDTGF
jgi:Circadian oscillating protein COP23